MVKQGYKQTEIGVIPEDWEVKKVSEISRITTGNKNTQDRIENGIYPFFVRSQTIEHINSFSFEGEAVLTAGDGVGVGKVFHYINGKFDYHQRVYAISHFDTNVYGFYFFKYFQNNFYNRIMQMTAKSSVDSVRMETIADMLIPLPPLPEQEAIAEALSDADAWIESLEQLIAKKRLIKQGAMQELLTPPSTSSGNADGEALEPWEVKKLGEVIDTIIGGGTPSRTNSDFWGGDIPWMTVKDFTTFDPNETQEYITIEGLKNSATRIVPAGSLIIATRIALGKIVRYQVDVAINQDLKTIELKSIIDNDFFIYKYRSMADKIIEKGSGSTVLGLSIEDLKGFEISFPSLSEQTRIATILSDMDAELEALEQKLSKARQIKQGMMQELLTGRIRL